MVVVGKLAWLAHSSGSANNRAMLYSVDVSHDGSRLVTGGLDSKARVWSVSKIMEALHAEVERQKKVVEDEKSQVTTFFFCVYSLMRCRTIQAFLMVLYSLLHHMVVLLTLLVGDPSRNHWSLHLVGLFFQSIYE